MEAEEENQKPDRHHRRYYNFGAVLGTPTNGTAEQFSEGYELIVVPAPDFQSGGAGFQTRGHARYINFGALALVAASLSGLSS